MMSTEAPRNLFFYELCRLCLENAGATDVFESGEFLEDIFACTGVKLAHADNLPHKVCTKCLDIVKSSKELRILAKKNDAHLRTLFGDVDSDAETVILEPSTRTTHETASKAGSETSEPKSSKEKLSFLLQEGEENSTKAIPMFRQTIVLRKDLFPPSSQSASSPTETKTPDKILKVKVEEENRCKRTKTGDDDETVIFHCNDCDKSFDKYKKLYLHQRLHNKKIFCPLDACGKKFATKGDMEKHIRTHTGEKPFKCKQCKKSFAQRVSLRQHISSLHDEDDDDD
ncbi:zinc finger and SCAN domain-containing protein 5A-like isoform X1 [Cydia splendana]|uniref:zinc finger and SCAN domain-containing protein 5A-like isoform X1 n=1 Tax=Cydia splendana TaxID=1100963 RepID=UPI002146EE9A